LELPSVDSSGDSNAEAMDQVFIAFARIFSGRLQRGKKLFVLGPKHDPAKVYILLPVF
jgi:ribosome assembly protein 1